jgi:hypothetical protein
MYDTIKRVFSPAALKAAASRGYDRPNEYGPGFACADGLCVAAVMLRTDKLSDRATMPTIELIEDTLDEAGKTADLSDDEYAALHNELTDLIEANDDGLLLTPEHVAARLLTEDA